MEGVPPEAARSARGEEELIERTGELDALEASVMAAAAGEGRPRRSPRSRGVGSALPSPRARRAAHRGPAGRGLAELGAAELHVDPAAAVRRLEEALAGAGDARRRAELALLLSRSLILSSRLGEAVELLERAIAEVGTGDSQLALRLEAELTGVASLTPSERPVASLAADALTNRQIAETLFVTEKTVELHLSATYKKLDIRSRSQLPPSLAESTAGVGAAVGA